MLTFTDKLIGAVLVRSIEAGANYAVSEIEPQRGHVAFSHGLHLIVKRASSDSSTWRFNFTPRAVAFLYDLQRSSQTLFGGVYIALVCDGDICELKPADWLQLLDTDAPESHQSLTVHRSHGKSFRVRGSRTGYTCTVPVSRFPSYAA